MSNTTGIQWTDATWNPVSGCTKVSRGCKNCYAETWAGRHMGEFSKDRDRKFTDIRCHPEKLDIPLRWRKPRRIFVNSMSDLFHEDVPAPFIDLVFAAMAQAPHHTFQVLTKRPKRMLDWFRTGDPHLRMTRCFVNFKDYTTPVGPWPLPNVWLGVSVEDQATADERIPLLLQTPAAVRFVSAEPLLGPVDVGSHLACKGCGTRHRKALPTGAIDCCPDGGHMLDWIIVGGESGPGARPFDIQWARDIIAQCKAASVPVFVKQLGAAPLCDGADCRPMKLGRVDGRRFDMRLRDRKGADMAEWPEDLRVREFPR